MSDENIKLLLQLQNWSQRCDRVRFVIDEYEEEGKRIKDLQIRETTDHLFHERKSHRIKWCNEYEWHNIGADGYKKIFLGVKLE